MVVPGATRVGGGNGAAGSIANLDDEGGITAAPAAAASTPASSCSFLSRLPRPPPPRVLLSEASGAVGDLGTFLPLTLGLVAAVGLDFGTTLIFTGIYNVVSGLAFGVPMPVQPMKTIAAVAVAASSSSTSSSKNPITLEEVMAAGMFVSAVVLFLGLTRLVDVVNRIVPRSVVAGLQLGVGLKLAASGVQSVFKKKTKGWRAAGGVEGWGLGAAALVFLFVSTVAPRSRKEEQEQGERNSSPSSSLLSLPPSPSSPSLLLLPRRLQEALLERKRRKQRRDDESESSGSIGGGSSSSGASAEPSLPLASPAADASAAAAEGGGGEQTDPTDSPPPHPPPSSSSSWQVPSALLVSALGVALAFASAPAAARSALRLGPSRVVAAAPTLRDWANGITRAGGLAQLPLTTLNSVIAVSHLADSLYGGGESGRGGGAGGGSGNAAAAGGNGRSEGGGGGSSSSSAAAAPSPSLHHHHRALLHPPRDKARWKPSRVAVAVGLYNLLGGWFGAVPACMGSGGLAAQHKFGARGGSAPILLGVFKISLALALGSSLSSILRFFPSGLLGAMLALAGAELAAAARAGGGGGGGGGCSGGSGGDGTAATAGSENNSAALSSPRFFAFAALTAAAILGLDDPAAGFAVVWGLWLSTEAWERGAGSLKRAWREKRRRKIEDEKRGPASEKSEV